jgi:hypothetical protein
MEIDLTTVNKNLRDFRDDAVMGLVTAAWISATVFLFIHPSEVNFATWATFSATICGVYHWLCVFDDKRPDANNDDPSPT